MESIDKLRGWASYMLEGQLDRERDIHYLAQEIEAEFKERERQLQQCITAVDDEWRDIVAHDYMKLPLDADGVPIHVGDMIVMFDNPDGNDYRVSAIMEDAIYADGGFYKFMAVHVRHNKHRTIEDVLYDFGRDERWNDEGESAAVEREIIAKYAAEIRKITEV